MMKKGTHVRFIRSLPTGAKAPTSKTQAIVKFPDSAAGCTIPIEVGTLGTVLANKDHGPHIRSLLLGDQVQVTLIDGTVVEVWDRHLEESSAIDRLGQLSDPLRDK